MCIVYTLVFQEVFFFLSSSPIKDFCSFLIYHECCMPCLVSYPDTLILHFVVHTSVTIRERLERTTWNYILEGFANIYQCNLVLVATGQWGTLPVKVCVFLRTSLIHHHHHLPPWIRSFDLLQHRRIAIISCGVRDPFFCRVCRWGRISGVWCCPFFRGGWSSFVCIWVSCLVFQRSLVLVLCLRFLFCPVLCIL